MGLRGEGVDNSFPAQPSAASTASQPIRDIPARWFVAPYGYAQLLSDVCGNRRISLDRPAALVQHYVATLPAREHAVYAQRYAQNKSQLRAADALGLTRQQIRTLEERVRRGLARELARATRGARAPVTLRFAAEKE